MPISTNPTHGAGPSFYAYGNGPAGGESPSRTSDLECGCQDSFAHGVFGCLEPFRSRSETHPVMSYSPQPTVPDRVGNPYYDFEAYSRLSARMMRAQSSRSRRRDSLTASSTHPGTNSAPTARVSQPGASRQTSGPDLAQPGSSSGAPRRENVVEQDERAMRSTKTATSVAAQLSRANSQTPSRSDSLPQSSSKMTSGDNTMERERGTGRSSMTIASVAVQLSRVQSGIAGRDAAPSRAPSAAVSRDSTAERAELVARLSSLQIPMLEQASRFQRSARSGLFRQPERGPTWVGVSDVQLSTDSRASGSAPSRRPPPPPTRTAR